MKDKVFIAWSGTKEVAFQVKKILERKYNYVCSIGGNDNNDSTFTSVGDTVIQQMKGCNQAIVIFQNRKDGLVSNNLFFELGYVLATYGQKKIHCVKLSEERVVLPSDFDNSFIEPIDAEPENLIGSFAQGIVEYFIGRQKMSIKENKMFLINNRYLIYDKIVSHYSESGSKCSDYELAQYILFYMQAAYLFGDEEKVYKEILEFKNVHNYEFSSELSLAVNLCLSYFDLVSVIKADQETAEAYIEQNVFWKAKKEYEHYLDMLEEDDIGIFDEWATVFITEHLCFAYNLFANNKQTDENMRKFLYEKTVEYGTKTLEVIAGLEQQITYIENNDHTGLISLLKAYVYRNIYLSKNELKEDDAKLWLKKTLKERELLKNNFGKGTIDTKLYNAFCMEYYLSLVSFLSAENDNINEFEKMMYKNEIREYLNSVKKLSKENIYLRQISQWIES